MITHTDVTSVKVSQLETLKLRQELAHASRVMTVGELSGALAHELNQPLTSIIANAQAALRLLSLTPPNLAEVGDVLGDIVAAGRRAGEVIHRVRALMRPGAAQSQALDVNVVVEEVLDLVHSDLVGRGVTITTQLASPPPQVSRRSRAIAAGPAQPDPQRVRCHDGDRGRRATGDHRDDARGQWLRACVDCGPGYRHSRRRSRAGVRAVLHIQGESVGSRPLDLPVHRRGAQWPSLGGRPAAGRRRLPFRPARRERSS